VCGIKTVSGTPVLVTGDRSGVIKVWDMRTFACVQTLMGEDARGQRAPTINGICTVAPQNKIIAAGASLYVFESRKMENPLLTDDAPVLLAVFNPTTLTFATASAKEIKIWDCKTGQLLRTYRGLGGGGEAHASELSALCLDFRQRKLFTGDHLGHVLAYDYLNGAHMKTFRSPDVAAENGEGRAHCLEVSGLVYCNEHKILISASWDRTIRVHDDELSDAGVLLRWMSGGHAADITSLAYSYQTSLIASGSSDSVIQVWDFELGRLQGTCSGHRASITSLRFLDPFPLLLSTDADGKLRLWGTRNAGVRAYTCLFAFENSMRTSRQGSSAKALAAVMTTAVHIEFDTDSDTEDGQAEEKGDESWGADFSFTGQDGYMGRGEHEGNSEQMKAHALAEFLLFCGDDQGHICIWDLKPVILAIERQHRITALAHPHVCMNPRRQTSYDASEYFVEQRKAQQRINGLALGLSDSPGLGLKVKKRRGWLAHDDGVTSLGSIREADAILSSSFDRLVKLWNSRGDCIGVLRQGQGLSKTLGGGQRPSQPDVQWDFRVNLKERKERRRQEALKVKHEISKLERHSAASDLVSFVREDWESISDASVLDDIGQMPGFKELELGNGQRLSSAARTDGPAPRKTPKMKPINAKNAGKGFNWRGREARRSGAS